MIGFLFLVVGGWLVWRRADRFGLNGWAWFLVFFVGTMVLLGGVYYDPNLAILSGVTNAALLVFLYWYIPRRSKNIRAAQDSGSNSRSANQLL